MICPVREKIDIVISEALSTLKLILVTGLKGLGKFPRTLNFEGIRSLSTFKVPIKRESISVEAISPSSF